MPNVELNDNQKKLLLEIARKSIENAVLNKSLPVFKIDDPALMIESGAFVTIHKYGSLRGCIGNIIGRGPLWETVKNMAVEAALHDHRFRPVSCQEINEIDIEISVISPFEKIPDINQVEVGRHGLFIKYSFNQGLLLPQVAAEYGWDRKEFLEHTCLKAGLGRDCYRERGCQVYIFTATVFGEKDKKDINKKQGF